MNLYKFKVLDDFERIVDLLLRDRLYCPKPSELNDPLEGILGMRVPDHLPNHSPDTPFERAARFWLSNADELNRFRVCCFSKSPKSLLMWSYYGNGHSGICIEGDYSEYANRIQEVTYVEELPSNGSASFADQLRFKLSAWRHEEEVRIVLPPDVQGKYIRANIQRVLVGANFDSRYLLPLFEICRLKGYQVHIVSFSTSGEFNAVPIKNLGPW